jgi:hypothetical protein
MTHSHMEEEADREQRGKTGLIMEFIYDEDKL